MGCAGQQQADTNNTEGADLAGSFLTELNRLRATVVKPTNYTGAWLPLPDLSWSATLAGSAQTWANYLRDENGCNLLVDDSNPYGDTLAFGSVGFGPTQAVGKWSEEKAEFTYSPTYEGDAGNYTQIVWRSTLQVGCATAACDTGWQVFVCYYAPVGNVLGAQPY